jgi:hypothetical protein
MAIQTATTSQLEDAQRIAIEQARYTTEHNAVMTGLVEHMRLMKGEKSITVPKVGQMTANTLTDGVDLTQSDDIQMTSVSLTTSEVGLKVILTDKLVRQENEDVFRIVGRQMGDAMARKKDTDLLGLFSGFSVDLGAAGRGFELSNVAATIGRAKADKVPSPMYIVHHPWAVFGIMQSTTLGRGQDEALGVATTSAGFPADLSQEFLKDFYKFTLNRVPVFEDGNITVDGSNDAVGGLFAKESLVLVESVGFNTERERDASLRATELVVTADYGVFELDDAYGYALTFQAAAIATA